MRCLIPSIHNSLRQCGSTSAPITSTTPIPKSAPKVTPWRFMRHNKDADPDMKFLDVGYDLQTLVVAVLGLPNVGKSLLTNSLVGRSVSAASRKVNTTRDNIFGIIQRDHTQIVLHDTPGILNSKFSGYLKSAIDKEPKLACGPEEALRTRCGLIMVVVDVQFPVLHRRLMYLLHKYRTIPSILVINKIDLLDTHLELLKVTDQLCAGRMAGGHKIDMKHLISNKLPSNDRTQLRDTDEYLRTDHGCITLAEETVRNEKLYRQMIKRDLSELTDDQLRRCFVDNQGWPHFSAVFYVSALQRQCTDELREYLLQVAPKAPWMYKPNEYTNRSEKQLALDCARGALMDLVDYDIPYKCKLKILHWETNEHGLLNVAIDCICPNERATKQVIGLNGEKIKDIAASTHQRLRDVLAKDVYVRLAVRTGTVLKRD